MKSRGAGGAVALLLAAALAACGDSNRQGAGNAGADRNNTAVLGGYGKGPQAAVSAAAETITDAQGKPIAPPHHQAQLAKTGPDTALAVWVQDDHVVAATYAGGNWSAPQPLEEIFGQASDPRVASNGSGVAMAVWRHTVGKIESLRYSRFETAAGWAVPDVMPGALPRPRSEGAGAAPQLRMDAQGQAVAEWPSGFASGETQTARYVPGQGWSRALSEPVAAAPAPTSVQ
jgi:ABC-type Fe3+-hydroxamate transport system substrate-binding protein